MTSYNGRVKIKIDLEIPGCRLGARRERVIVLEYLDAEDRQGDRGQHKGQKAGVESTSHAQVRYIRRQR